MYTDPREYDTLMTWLLNLLKANTSPGNSIEKAICSAIETGCSFMYVEFERNSKTQGSIIGLGKEPDVPYSNQYAELVTVGETHRKGLKIKPVGIFILSEDLNHATNETFFNLSGAKIYTHIIAPPTVETLCLKVERGHDNRMIKVHDDVQGKVNADHKGFINAYMST